MSVRPTILSIDVIAATEELAHVREIVRRHAGGAGFKEREVSEIELAVDEAFTNIITHALPPKSGQTVELRLESASGRLVISLFDHGRPFDGQVAEAPDIRALAKSRQKGGMGVFLIHRLMDTVEYRRAGGRNEIRMSKKLPD